MKGEVVLYPLWLRIWHWTNALLFVVLLITGLSMHYSTPGYPLAGYRASVLSHNVAGILLTAGYVVFLVGNYRTGNGRFYRLSLDDVTWGALRQVRYYLLGMFLGEPHPFPHSAERKFNPLQKLSYLAVMFALVPLIIVAGWALLFPEFLPRNLFGLPGIALWAIVHTYLGYFASVFMIIHTYLGTTGETPGELFRCMLRGQTIPRDALMPAEGPQRPPVSPAAQVSRSDASDQL
ncbi:MAG TPA: cytochrome b/b6 domain-containing protein [Candidatus Binatia bacterium]|jgi:thiosulfate reductase cytochrome b subunit